MYTHVIQTTMASSTGIGGRVDIAIRPDTSGRILPVFWLESKVGSPLTHELLDGIRVRLIEDHPSMRKLKRSGVDCGREADESGGSPSMGWHLKTGKWVDWHFGVGVSFAKPVSFWAYLEGDKVKRRKDAG
jgi:hypothetical protein